MTLPPPNKRYINIEVTPPASADELQERLDSHTRMGFLPGFSSFSVTHNPQGHAHCSSLGYCHFLRLRGFKVIWHITSRSFTEINLRADALFAQCLGLTAAIVIRGDARRDIADDDPTLTVNQAAHILREYDHKVSLTINQYKPSFDQYVDDYRGIDPELVTTQLAYDLDLLEPVKEFCSIHAPNARIVPSFLPGGSPKFVKFLHDNLRIKLSDNMLERLSKWDEGWLIYKVYDLLEKFGAIHLVALNQKTDTFYWKVLGMQ